jgi:protein gp37
MGKNSSIEWTHHTFNPWWGCVKVSPACKHCYAETWARRVGQDLWGALAPRRFFSETHWREPLRWNAEAQSDGERRRVFCASMADVFEDRRDLDAARDRLWRLIDDTPWLDWLLLTKRADRVAWLAPWGTSWPANVWLGTTVENQHWAERRIDAILAEPAAVHFLSCEPILGPLDLAPWLAGLDWVIAGGESGGRARPMNPAWVSALRDQCLAHHVHFHFKQWGHWAPAQGEGDAGPVRVYRNGEQVVRLIGMGKRRAGRVLDGATWDQVPQT